MSQQVRTAVFRPDDGHIERVVESPDSPGTTPAPDPMLVIEPTGVTPEPGAFVALTSKTDVESLGKAGWNPDDAAPCCTSPTAADVTHGASWMIDRVLDKYTSAGLVDHLAPDVNGVTTEIARSDHGNTVLTDGLCDTDTDVHETMLYRPIRPGGAGESAELAAAGDLEAVPFTSSLTVERFLDAAVEHGIREEVIAGLSDTVVGTIGSPTRNTVESHGIDVTAIPDEAVLEALAVAAVETTVSTYHG